MHHGVLRFGVLSTWYTKNKFSTFTEEINDVDDVPANEISLRETAGKISLSGGQEYKRLQPVSQKHVRAESLGNCAVQKQFAF